MLKKSLVRDKYVRDVRLLTEDDSNTYNTYNCHDDHHLKEKQKSQNQNENLSQLF